jgi:UDP-glucose 4-epimerase
MILVTGASGFLGSWIVRALQLENIRVAVLVRPGTDCWRLEGLKNLEVVRQASADWPKTIALMSPRVVVATDWEGVDGANRGDQQMQFGNVARGYAVGEASKNSGVETFIAFGSQAETGPHLHAITENEKDNPATMYGEAKVDLRRRLSSLFANSDTRFVWGRVFSIYGPLDSGSGMLPTLIRNLQNGRVFNATEGDQVWSYLYASDFASAVLRLIGGSQYKYVVNIGNPEPVQIGDVIRAVAQYMNRSDLVNFGAAKIDSIQSQFLVPITSHLTREMWSPKVTINDGIRRTVDWFAGTQISLGSQILPLKQ